MGSRASRLRLSSGGVKRFCHPEFVSGASAGNEKAARLWAAFVFVAGKGSGLFLKGLENVPAATKKTLKSSNRSQKATGQRYFNDKGIFTRD